MIPWIAQLDCAIEVVAAEGSAQTPPGARAASLDHVIEFQDALTGEALGASEVASLALTAEMQSTALTALAEETAPDGTLLRRAWTLARVGDTYTLRVDAEASRRYFGCSRALPIGGPVSRRVRVSLVPRARDVTLNVEVRRGSASRGVTEEGLRALELRPAASVERELEVHRGRCSGEVPPTGSHWCVRALTAAPQRYELTALLPGFGLASLVLDGHAPERTVALAARYDGHFMPAVTVRLGVAWAAVNGGGVGVLGSVDVMAASARDGQTCPLGDTCVRPVLHLGAGDVPYARETVLVGPGTQRVSEGTVSGDLGLVEVGAGVTVVPAGTGDALRFGLTASGVLGFRGEETLSTLRTPLSQATARFGAAAELLATYRLVGPLGVHLGARIQWFPGFADVGRRFSFLGDATRTGESASLLQVVLQAGLGVEL